MIARIWHGVTREPDASEYFEFLERTGLRDYLATPGNRGVWVLRRTKGGRAHFLLMSLWDSLDSIRAFAGPDVARARYYPEDDRFLIEKESTVEHYDVLAEPDDGAKGRS